MRWPVLLAMALLLAPGGMLAMGMRAGPLLGARVAAPPPELSWSALWSGAFQHTAGAWFGQADPALPAAVALRNQAYVSLLRQSALPDILIGPGLQLVERATLDSFCGRPIFDTLPPEAEAHAARLAAMQAWYAARDRVFVYLLTPTKIGSNPAIIPAGWPCRGGAPARARLLALWRAALQRHGVRLVDGPAAIDAARGTAPLFPRGGTHWNWIGAALATQAFIAAVDQARPGALPPFTFMWHDAPPAGTDRDLTDLLNLPYPPLDYAAPVIDLTASAPSYCRQLSIAEIGGSFTFSVDFLLARLPCPAHIALYTYFQVERTVFDPFTRGPADPTERRTALLDTADIVVLEENEDLAFHARHAEQLWALVQERLQAR